MTAAELAHCWVPVPMRWKTVVSGDVFVGRDGELWTVGDNELPRGGQRVRARRGGDSSFSRIVDPDELVPVLVQIVERDAIELTVAELGARVIERRNLREAS